MNHPDNGTNSGNKTLAVVGAGPKAAAIAAKADALRECGFRPTIDIVVIEQKRTLAANWKGRAGFTDGTRPLGTPPEKDIGFPYRSIYGTPVDSVMLKYSWQEYRVFWLAEESYSDWVDEGRLHPNHKSWAAYIEWALEMATESDQRLTDTTLERVAPANHRLELTCRRRRRKPFPKTVDGIVFTGPGNPLLIERMPPNKSPWICDGKNYWTRIGDFEKLPRGKIAIIGGGEIAASIALSLLDRAPRLRLCLINRSGAIFSRRGNFSENRRFSAGCWSDRDELSHWDFIKRTDRGVYSAAAQRRIELEDSVEMISGDVFELSEKGGKVRVHLRRGAPPKQVSYDYDAVVVAIGFDPWSPLMLFPETLRPPMGRDYLEQLKRRVDKHLRVPFDSITERSGEEVNVHMPMVAALQQGPGFPNLSCLGHLSDQILSLYVPPPKVIPMPL